MNFWLGNEQLVIRWGIGIIYKGAFEKCLDFCHNREEAYEMMNF